MEISKAMKQALVALGALAVFGAVLAWLVANDMPVTKEFVGAIAGGIVSIAVLAFGSKLKDDMKQAKDDASEARGHAREAWRASVDARTEAGKTDRDKKREKRQRKRELS